MKTGCEDKVFRFLHLPLELRNRIYELVLYRHANEGVIAPVYREIKRPRPKFKYEFRTVIKGSDVLLQRYEYSSISDEEDSAEHCHALTCQELEQCYLQGHMMVKITEYFSTTASQEELIDMLDKSSTWELERRFNKPWFFVHVCQPECLLQPALTRVNRQVRLESLPVFYSENDFYLELPQKLRHSGLPLPITWWRAIGNSRLKPIKSLSIHFHDHINAARLGIQAKQQHSSTR